MATKNIETCRVGIESLEPLLLMSASPSGTDANDILMSSAPDMDVSGGDGHDILIALAGDGKFDGGDGHDTFICVRSNNVLDGGDGQDTMVYWQGEKADFEFARSENGELEISRDGKSDVLKNFESIQFTDGTHSVEDLLAEADNVDPEANDETYYASVNERVYGDLRNNDTDSDGLVSELTYEVVKEPLVGLLKLLSNGSFEYSPPDRFVGIVSFDYNVSDARNGSSQATATIHVVDFEGLLS